MHRSFDDGTESFMSKAPSFMASREIILAKKWQNGLRAMLSFLQDGLAHAARTVKPELNPCTLPPSSLCVFIAARRSPARRKLPAARAARLEATDSGMPCKRSGRTRIR
jgi:hypothetical protein